MAIISYFSVQSGILVQLLSASYKCGNCKVQEIWDSTCGISENNLIINSSDL